MNPHQKNKIDISSLSADEQRLFRLYGKLPNKKDLLQNKLKERKYFDSGDYAMSKAGKSTDAGLSSLGTQHPLPENIPHLATPATGPNGTGVPGAAGVAPLTAGQSGSPVKESSFLHRETSADEVDLEQPQEEQKSQGRQPTENAPHLNRPDQSEPSVSPPVKREGVPIRWQS